MTIEQAKLMQAMVRATRARAAFIMWAQYDGQLGRDERKAKHEAEREMRAADRALAKLQNK